MTKRTFPPIHLSKDLDRDAIRDTLRQHRRVQVKDVFPDAVADRLFQCLSKEVEWNTIFSDGDEKVHAMHPIQVSAMTSSQSQWLTDYINNKARYDYQFIYHNYPIWDLLHKKIAPDLYVFKFVEFFNSPEFLDFIRYISEVPSIGMADSQATLFKPGHFLSRHTDRDHTYKGRRMAYVLNMTPEWRTEWGGILEFLDDAGKVIEGFVPCFNTLNLFHVPIWHHVSYVAPFAAGGRYGLTGWLRDKTDGA